MSHESPSHAPRNPWAESPVPATRESRKEAQARLFPVLAERFGAALDPLDAWNLTAIVSKETVHACLQFLRDDAAWKFDTLVDVTAVDYLEWPGHEGPRFAVVWNLKSQAFPAHRARVKVLVEEDDLEVPTASDLWKIADWQERETWDQYGIVFTGHPNLKRLLNHCEFVGHPLRKDYPAQRRQKLSANDPMIDQMQLRLKTLGYTLLDSIPETSPQVEDVMGEKR